MYKNVNEKYVYRKAELRLNKTSVLLRCIGGDCVVRWWSG